MLSKNFTPSPITNYLKAHNMTLKEFCEFCGVSENAIKNFLKRKSCPRINTLIKIRKMAKIRIEDYLKK